MTDPLAAFADYVRAVGRRLELGRVQYGDRSFSRSPNELLIELQQEAEDCAGWGFVLWERLRSMRSVLGDVAPLLPARGAERPSRSAPASTQVGRVVTIASSPGRVFVLPLLRQADLTFAPLPPLELSRVPCAGELVLLPALGTARVMSVRHTPGDAGDAEVYLEPAATEKRVAVPQIQDTASDSGAERE